MNTSDMWLVYIDGRGEQHTQHWNDIVDSGSLIDPDTGEDMDVVGWIAEEEN